MPVPNAFDTLIKAINKQVDKNKAAFALETRHTTGVKEDREYTWAEKRKIFASNSTAVDLVHQALAEEYVNPPCRSISTIFPYYAQFRSLSRIISLGSQVRANDGDYRGAFGLGLDSMEMGVEIKHGSTLIGGLVGIACESIGRRGLWPYVDHLTEKEALEAIRRMERIRAKQVPFAETMKEEKWAMQAALMEIMRSPNSVTTLSQNLGMNSPLPPLMDSPALSNLFYMVYSKRRVMSDFTTYMDAEIERASKPYGTVLAAPVPKDPLVEMLVPVFDQARIKSAETETQSAMLEIALALRVYRLRHGAYPANLVSLMPDPLPHPLIDPFSSGAGFQYKPSSNAYVLYSIGPDRKDDGGKPIDAGASRVGAPNERYFVRPDSVGDVVAGTNLW